MRYFIVIDNLGTIIYTHSGNNFETIIEGHIEINEEDYRILESQMSNYNFKYENGKIVNTGKRILEIPITPEQQILDGVNLLIELQADLIGGAI